jgi:hypothetical protein
MTRRAERNAGGSEAGENKSVRREARCRFRSGRRDGRAVGELLIFFLKLVGRGQFELVSLES